MLDFQHVAAELGAFFAGEFERVTAEFAAGQAQAYSIAGPGYSGLVLIRFEARLSDGAKQLHVVTAKGEGLALARADLARVAKASGAVALTADAEDFGVLEMYRRDKWRVESARVRLEL